MFRWILLSVLACPVIASAQMVRGTVTEAGAGTPVQAVNLTLFTTDGQQVGNVLSDQDGKFEIVLPKGKTVYLQAARIGYETVKSNHITATTSELLEIKVRMSAVPIPLQGVEVVARRQVDPRLREFMDRASLYKRAGIGHIWTRKELERRPLSIVSAANLLTWVPRTHIFNCAGVSVFIDDMPVDSGDIALLVAPEDLEGVEMYDERSVPPDLVFRSRAQTDAGTKLADNITAAENRVAIASHGEVSGDTLQQGVLLPPCQTILLWRKPYAELKARNAGHPVNVWRALLILGGFLVVEILTVGGGF